MTTNNTNPTKAPDASDDEPITPYDLAMWLINFEFQDPKNRHMSYRELARIYATKIESYANHQVADALKQAHIQQPQPSATQEVPVAGDDEILRLASLVGTDAKDPEKRLMRAIRTKYRSVEEIESAIQLVSHRAGLLIREYMTNSGIDKVAPVGALRVGTNELRQKLNLGGTNGKP